MPALSHEASNKAKRKVYLIICLLIPTKEKRDYGPASSLLRVFLRLH